MVTDEQEKSAKTTIDCAFEVHTQLGPGLLENVYQTCLAFELRNKGIFIEVEKPLPVVYKNNKIDCGYRTDIIIEHNQIIIENKSVKQITDIHLSQLLTYMRLSNISLGFIFNFNVRHFKDGIKRVVL